MKKKKMRILELTSDPVFKSFMMSENTINYKSRLIHLITGIPEEDLKKATYTSQELRLRNKKDKVFKTDIIIDIDTHKIHVEMNADYYTGLINKSGSYIGRIFSEQLDKGDSYLNMKKIIQINIDDFNLYKGNKLIYEFIMREKDSGEIENDNIISYHIDLKYLRDKCYNEEENIEILKGDVIMDEAINELEKISQDEKIIGLYDAEKVQRKVYNTKIQSAKNEGIKEGSLNKSIDIAKNLLNMNLSVEDISKATGLTCEQVEDLK